MKISKEIQLYIIKNTGIISDLTKIILEIFYGQKISDLFFGSSDKNRIAVLGAFDTWPYMDLVCRILSKANYIAITSRYVYHNLNNKIIRFPSVYISQLASTDLSMKRLLTKIINNCLLAIINYSVSAAHYIETDWCESVPDLDFIGIAYVRDIFKIRNCENLKILELPGRSGNYSLCNAIESNYYLSFGPAILYSKKIQNFIKFVDPQHILTESDAPYGIKKIKFNPIHIIEVVKKISELKSTKLEDIISIINHNMMNFLKK